MTSTYDGGTAELYHAQTLNPTPIDTTEVSGSKAEFSVLPAGNLWAFRVISGGTTTLRSGIQDQSAGEFDGGGFTAEFLAMPVTDPDQTVIDLDALTEEVELPIVEDSLVISSLEVAGDDGALEASGDASYQLTSNRSVPLTYTYRFRLEPVTAALSSRLVRVETESVAVEGTAGGLLGWVINAVVSLVTTVFEDDIADAMEDAVQQQVDAAVGEQTEGPDIPPGTGIHLRSITIDDDAVTLEPHVMAPLQSLTCPFSLSSGSVRLRDPSQLRALWSMRDRVLVDNARGRAYLTLLAHHGPEVTRLLAANRDLLAAADRTIERGLRDFDVRAPGEGVMSQETAEVAMEAVQALARHASPALQRVLRPLSSEIREFVGRPVADVLEESVRDLDGRDR